MPREEYDAAAIATYKDVRDLLLLNLLDLLRVDLCRDEGLGCIVYTRLELLQRILNIVPAGATASSARTLPRSWAASRPSTLCDLRMVRNYKRTQA